MRHFSPFRVFLFSALLMPVLLMFSACHSTRKSTVQTQTTPNHDSIALRKACQRWLGTPYRYGGFTTEGIDCSGLVCQIYLTLYQQKLPRTSEQLRTVSTPISTAQLTYGDLVFFGSSPQKVSHVGIYLGSGQFVHASSSKGVIISRLSETWYKNHFLGGGRLHPRSRKK
ncbi:MAG: C40 family peptidase [Chitinophagaceae bacterium]|nr:C40 family peptidase [Chitinophagaceae bacterium]